MVDRAKDERFMRMALQEAKEAFDADEIPVGAVIVCKDRVVARAHNLTECLGDVTAHAEMQAITSAAASLGGKYLTDCTLYVTLEPCPMCAGAILNARIPRVYYGARDREMGACGGVLNLFMEDFPQRPALVGGILEEECRGVLTDFFRRLRKI